MKCKHYYPAQRVRLGFRTTFPIVINFFFQFSSYFFSLLCFDYGGKGKNMSIVSFSIPRAFLFSNRSKKICLTGMDITQNTIS